MKKVLLIVVIILTLLLGCFVSTHNKSYKNKATERGEYVYLNGIRYSATSKLKKYSISNIMICKTDTGMKLYEIEEYPDYEYIAGYHMWDGEIYVKDPE